SKKAVGRTWLCHSPVFGWSNLRIREDRPVIRCRDDHDPPPPPPLPGLNRSKRRRHDSSASGSTQPPAPQSSAWKTSNTQETPSNFSRKQSASHSEQPIKDVPIIHNVNVSDSEEINTAHLPKLKIRLDEAGSKRRQTSLAFNAIRPLYDNNISLQFQMEECHRMLTNQVDLVNPEGRRIVSNIRKPLPLRGPQGQVTIQSQYFFNKDLEYLVLGDKGRRLALSISKLKAAHYLDFGLEELVPSL
nr:hypothetical protein [Tanacetum cinerariifolium]